MDDEEEEKEEEEGDDDDDDDKDDMYISEKVPSGLPYQSENFGKKEKEKCMM